MPIRKLRVKKTVAEDVISVEGSRALEPQLTPEEPAPITKRSRMTMKTYAIITLVIVVILLLASLPAAYFYQKYQSAKPQNSTAAAEAQVKSLVAEVGKVVLLPTGEVPTVATVSDKSKLTDQSFFAHSENGDKVLIYTTAKKAILYRPGTHMIIEIGPINIQADAGTAQVAGASTSATTKTTPITVGLLNGTTVAGLTKKVELTLTTAIPAVTVTEKTNAVTSDYTETLVIPLTPAGKAIASKVTTTVAGKISTLPAGEVAPTNTDLLIILGQTAAQ